MTSSKDLFSAQSAAYSQYRPTYPPALFDWLASASPRRDLAWDCACGNGQATGELARRFARVEATDLSAAQLASAAPIANVVFRRATAGASGLPDASVDAIAVAQALHWFANDEFAREAARVARGPETLLAAWGYALCSVDSRVDELIGEFYRGELDAHWEPERRLVDRRYATVRFPFPEVQAPAFAMSLRWTAEQMLGYLGTWSAVKTAEKTLGRRLVDEFAPALLAAWPAAEVREVTWPLFVRAWRLRL